MQVGMLAFLGPIGLPELVIIMVILILIFGANRLSGIGKGMGQAIRGFKDEMKTDDKSQTSNHEGPNNDLHATTETLKQKKRRMPERSFAAFYKQPVV